MKSSPFPSFNDENHAKLYLKVWQEAFNELPNEETRNCCLYWLKLGIEKLMETTPPKNIKDFEDLRFDIRRNYDTLALEGICSSCQYPTAISIKMTDYMKRASPSSDNSIIAKCTVCLENCRIGLPML